MTTIELNGASLNPNKEWEKFFNDHGVNVHLVWKKGIEYTLYNVTEVHCNYKTGHIAFESDIKFTGGTRKLDDLVSITINKADKIIED